MKNLFSESKRRVLEKLKYILEKLKYIGFIFAALADIFKSFAAIIGSLFAGIMAGVTGYYEVKKVIRKEKSHKNEENRTVKTSPPSNLLSGGASESMAYVPEPKGYSFDVNSGAFVISILMLAVIVLKRTNKTNKTNKGDKP